MLAIPTFSRLRGHFQQWLRRDGGRIPRTEAILVVGPESSGTRMLTEAFMRCGYFGDSDHLQRLDSPGFVPEAKRIVWRRSLPHGGEDSRSAENPHWPNLGEMVETLRAKFANVRAVLIFRDKDFTVLSQIRQGHVNRACPEAARDRISMALAMAYHQLASVGCWPIVTYFEAMTFSPKVREAFFGLFDLSPPEMDFYDADRKYLPATDPALARDPSDLAARQFIEINGGLSPAAQVESGRLVCRVLC